MAEYCQRHWRCLSSTFSFSCLTLETIVWEVFNVNYFWGNVYCSVQTMVDWVIKSGREIDIHLATMCIWEKSHPAYLIQTFGTKDQVVILFLTVLQYRLHTGLQMSKMQLPFPCNPAEEKWKSTRYIDTDATHSYKLFYRWSLAKLNRPKKDIQGNWKCPQEQKYVNLNTSF